MLDYDKQRTLIVVCILAIILTIVISIVALVFIWKPEPVEENKFEVGMVTATTVTENDILKKHYETISKLLEENKIDEFCKFIGKDYLEYYNYTIDDVKALLENRMITGKNLELANSAIYSIIGYTKVYYLELKSVGEIYTLGIVIREKTPENYTITLDKFIDYSTNSYANSSNSVELSVLKRARFTTNVEYRIRITNNYHDAITLNTNKTTSSLILVAADGKFKKPVTYSLFGISETIPAGQSREYEATFNINEDMDFLLYNVFVLKDVSYTGMGGTSSLEYYM